MILRKYISGIMIAAGTSLLLYSIYVLDSSLSTLGGVVLGAALILSGILFWFRDFEPERRNCSICMLTFGFLFILAGIIVVLFVDPILAIGAFLLGSIVLISGVLFWFLEPKGSGPWI